MNSTTTSKTSTKASRSLSTRPIVVQLDHDIGHDAEHQSHVGDLVSPPDSPTRPRGTTRALRRKKHLSIYRTSAPPQSPVAEVAIEIPLVVRPQSMVSPPSTIDDSPSYPPTKPQMHMHARTQSQPNVRLGHPSRPYYSAIRKNMSRPNSPYDSPYGSSSRPASPSRATSPTFGYLPQTFEDSDDDETPSASRAASPSTLASRFSFGGSSALHSGFSVSGEMEMRMALAALSRGQQQESSFQFQETAKAPSSVHGRVMKLGKGLKDLVRKKHAYASQ